MIAQPNQTPDSRPEGERSGGVASDSAPPVAIDPRWKGGDVLVGDGSEANSVTLTISVRDISLTTNRSDPPIRVTAKRGDIVRSYSLAPAGRSPEIILKKLGEGQSLVDWCVQEILRISDLSAVTPDSLLPPDGRTEGEIFKKSFLKSEARGTLPRPSEGRAVDVAPKKIPEAGEHISADPNRAFILDRGVGVEEQTFKPGELPRKQADRAPNDDNKKKTGRIQELWKKAEEERKSAQAKPPSLREEAPSGTHRKVTSTPPISPPPPPPSTEESVESLEAETAPAQRRSLFASLREGASRLAKAGAALVSHLFQRPSSGLEEPTTKRATEPLSTEPRSAEPLSAEVKPLVLAPASAVNEAPADLVHHAEQIPAVSEELIPTPSEVEELSVISSPDEDADPQAVAGEPLVDNLHYSVDPELNLIVAHAGESPFHFELTFRDPSGRFLHLFIDISDLLLSPEDRRTFAALRDPTAWSEAALQIVRQWLSADEAQYNGSIFDPEGGILPSATTLFDYDKIEILDLNDISIDLAPDPTHVPTALRGIVEEALVQSNAAETSQASLPALPPSHLYDQELGMEIRRCSHSIFVYELTCADDAGRCISFTVDIRDLISDPARQREFALLANNNSWALAAQLHLRSFLLGKRRVYSGSAFAEDGSLLPGFEDLLNLDSTTIVDWRDISIDSDITTIPRSVKAFFGEEYLADYIRNALAPSET